MWPKIISLEASIGAGKTTLMQILEKELDDCMCIYEPVNEWRNIAGENLLELFYKNPQRWAYTFQDHCFETRAQTLEKTLKRLDDNIKYIIMERSWFSDRECFSQILHEEGSISDLEWVIYKNRFDWLISKTPSIHGFIYLNTPLKTCIDRIQKRGRNEEINIPVSYLKKLEEKHNNWLLNHDKCLVIDGVHEFETDESVRNSMIEHVKTFMKML